MGRDKKPLTKISNSEKAGGGGGGGGVCSLKYLIFIYASILYNIARKSRGKSMSSYLLMNINNLSAMVVSPVV